MVSIVKTLIKIISWDAVETLWIVADVHFLFEVVKGTVDCTYPFRAQ